MFLITIISIVLGFAKESAVVYKMGVSNYADAYVFLSNLPTVLFSSIGGVLSTTFMPLFTDVRVNYGIKEANSFATTFLKNTLKICMLIVLFIEVVPQILIYIMAPGFTKDSVNIQMGIRLVIPTILLLSFSYVFIGILNSYKDVVIPSAIQIPMHLMIITTVVLLYNKVEFTSLLSFIFIGAVIQVVIMYWRTRRWDFRFEKNTKIGNKYYNKALKMIGPMFIGIMSYQINSIVATRLASNLGVGNITMLNIANKLYNASYSTLGYLIVLIVYPIFSEYAAKKKNKLLEKELAKSIALSMIILIPISAIIIVFSEKIIYIFFGNVSAENIKITSDILKILSVGLVVWGIKDILNRVYYSFKETRVSMINGIITVIINIVISVILIRSIGIIAIALASTTSGIVSVILLLRKLKKIDINLNIKEIIKSLFYILVYITPFTVIIVIINKIYNNNSRLALLTLIAVASMIFMISYVGILFIVRDKYITSFFNIRKRRFDD
jgi:putative peptidoglycan lipid II flippase